MGFWKFVSIATVLFAVTVNASNFPYDPAFIEEINDIVVTQKSNTVVMLVVQDEIIFVSTEGNASKQMKEHREEVHVENLEIVEATFVPLNTTDVLEKFTEIGITRRTFLAYFTAQSNTPNNSVTLTNTKPVGLLGKLLEALGINVNEPGLLSIILSLLGIGTSVTEVTRIEFENDGTLNILNSTISSNSA